MLSNRSRQCSVFAALFSLIFLLVAGRASSDPSQLCANAVGAGQTLVQGQHYEDAIRKVDKGYKCEVQEVQSPAALRVLASLLLVKSVALRELKKGIALKKTLAHAAVITMSINSSVPLDPLAVSPTDFSGELHRYVSFYSKTSYQPDYVVQTISEALSAAKAGNLVKADQMLTIGQYNGTVDWLLWYYRGWVDLARRDKEAAVFDFFNSLHSSPRDPDGYVVFSVPSALKILSLQSPDDLVGQGDDTIRSWNTL